MAARGTLGDVSGRAQSKVASLLLGLLVSLVAGILWGGLRLETRPPPPIGALLALLVGAAVGGAVRTGPGRQSWSTGCLAALLCLPGLGAGLFMQARWGRLEARVAEIQRDPEFLRTRVLPDEVAELVEATELSSVLLKWVEDPLAPPDPLVAPMLPEALEKAARRFSARPFAEQDALWLEYARADLAATPPGQLLAPLLGPDGLTGLGLSLVLAFLLGASGGREVPSPEGEESEGSEETEGSSPAEVEEVPLQNPAQAGAVPLSGGPEVIQPLGKDQLDPEAPRPRKRLRYREGIRERNRDPHRH